MHIKQASEPSNAFANSNQLFEKLLIKPFVVYKMQCDGIIQRKSYNWQLAGKTVRTTTAKATAAMGMATATAALATPSFETFSKDLIQSHYMT